MRQNANHDVSKDRPICRLVVTRVYVYRVSELEEQLDNKDKEQREMKLKTDERIKMLEKKYVFLSVKDVK